MVFALSVEIILGLKKGTSAPKDWAIAFIFLLSVDTIILSTYLDFFKDFIDQYISGFLFIIFIFLFLSPLLPALAGMIAIIFFLFIKVFYFNCDLIYRLFIIIIYDNNMIIKKFNEK